MESIIMVGKCGSRGARFSPHSNKGKTHQNGISIRLLNIPSITQTASNTYYFWPSFQKSLSLYTLFMKSYVPYYSCQANPNWSGLPQNTFSKNNLIEFNQGLFTCSSNSKTPGCNKYTLIIINIAPPETIVSWTWLFPEDNEIRGSGCMVYAKET